MTARQKIAFQGELGAYSHQACVAAAPEYEPLPCPDFESAIAAVQNGIAARAMLPIDNTIAGRVADIHHFLPTSGLHIIAEYFQPIHHCLLGLRGANVDGITTVTSHIHALPQCRQMIAQKNWRKVVTSDTAVAAREVAQRNDPAWAAVASELAGEIYGLDILLRDIADYKGNTTRFVVMAREAVMPPVAGRAMTSLVFRLRSVPAALYKALGGFASNGLNLTKIESYFVDGTFDAAGFYVEVEGHADAPAMQQALEELGFFAQSITVMGVYPMHSFRESNHA